MHSDGHGNLFVITSKLIKILCQSSLTTGDSALLADLISSVVIGLSKNKEEQRYAAQDLLLSVFVALARATVSRLPSALERPVTLQPSKNVISSHRAIQPHDSCAACRTSCRSTYFKNDNRAASRLVRRIHI